MAENFKFLVNGGSIRDIIQPFETLISSRVPTASCDE